MIHMPLLTKYFYEQSTLEPTNQYIETGCYLGNGVKEVRDHYKKTFSIELSIKWYEYNVEQFKDDQRVIICHGDSKKLLPNLLNLIQEPVTIYLDAHYSGGTTAFGEEETPLLKELEILKERNFDDIIIIDDCRLLGKSGYCGISPDDLIYPTMHFDWTNITGDAIKARMKSNYKALLNRARIFSNGPEDQLILAPI
jgi:hypothetical protein